MSQPALLAVAHGSRNPEAAEVICNLAHRVRRLAPVLDVRVAFIGHFEPSLSAGLDAAGSGAVVVPLLLCTGYHLTADIAGAASSAGARVAAPLGPDQLLATALAGRLAEAGVPPGTPVVLAAAGSADPAAAPAVREQADLLAAVLDVPVIAAFASCGTPTVAEAVADMRARTGSAVAVASYLLAPGVFQDQLADSGADWVTEPIGEHPAVAGLVIERYRVAASARSGGVNAAAH
jgi:sirohydrochlorin ferrochelatase